MSAQNKDNATPMDTGSTGATLTDGDGNAPAPAAATSSSPDAMDTSDNSSAASAAAASEDDVTLDAEQQEALRKAGVDPEYMLRFVKAVDTAHKSSAGNKSQEEMLSVITDSMKQFISAVMEKAEENTVLREQLDKLNDRVKTQGVDQFRALVQAVQNSAENCEMSREHAKQAEITDEDWQNVAKAYEAIPDRSQREAMQKVMSWSMLNAKSMDAQLHNLRAQAESASAPPAEKTQRLKALDDLLAYKYNAGEARKRMNVDTPWLPSSELHKSMSSGFTQAVANSADPRQRYPGILGKTAREETEDERAKTKPMSFTDMLKQSIINNRSNNGDASV